MGQSGGQDHRRLQKGGGEMNLSILMPVYNEKKTVLDALHLVKDIDVDKEIILVDDCSNDGTRELLKEQFNDGFGEIKIYYHDVTAN